MDRSKHRKTPTILIGSSLLLLILVFVLLAIPFFTYVEVRLPGHRLLAAHAYRLRRSASRFDPALPPPSGFSLDRRTGVYYTEFGHVSSGYLRIGDWIYRIVWFVRS
jgi:hypothetical protein